MSSTFVWFDNFKDLFRNSEYLESFKITAIFSVLVAGLGIVISLLLATMADRVVLLRNGRIEQDATPAVLYETPATIFAARFVGTPPMNVIAASLVPDTLAEPRGGIRAKNPNPEVQQSADNAYLDRESHYEKGETDESAE